MAGFDAVGLSFVKKAWPQSIAGALMAAPAYFNISPDIAALVFWGLGGFGLLGLGIEIWSEFQKARSNEPRSKRRVAAWAGIACGAVILMFCGWYFWPAAHSSVPPGVVSEFDKIKMPELGKATRPIQITTGLYQASHEHAMVVSLLPTLDVFIFPDDQTKKAVRHHTADIMESRQWFDDAFLRGLFHPPKDKMPPESRVAELWSQNPNQWKWIGWRKWSCSFGLAQFYYQKFENGVIFGVLPTSENLGYSQIFSVAYSGEWSSTLSDKVSAPTCNKNTAKVGDVVIHGRFVKP